ncbi:MAG: hypothetical protein LBC52_01265 [Treponema sp.]|jgi:hypothetical protein|nr:hypothetical protein [Treponema sp.]
MKKMRIVFPVLLLVCAGIVMTGCPSETDPVKKVESPDLVFKGGKYQFKFDTPKIEHGKEYEVILTLIDYDEDFDGSQLGGKICYKMDLDDTSEEAKVLSGWKNPVPGQVSKNVTTYTWTFKAGEKNNDDIDPEVDATTPSGGKQFFGFEAQTSAWKPYGSNVSFGIKGGFEVKPKETVSEWTSEGTVTLGSEDGTAGKGTLSSADSAKIRDLPAGSKIAITVTVTVNAAGAGSNEPGWGVGSVGGWETTNSVPINIPGSASAGELTFTYEIEVSAIKAVFPTGDISINLYNGATASKLELFKPANAAPTTWVSEGTVTLGNVDDTVGKGELNAADMAKIRALPANSKIVLTVNATVGENPGPGWGVGTIGTWVSEDSLKINIPGNAANGPIEFTVEFKISDVLAIVGASGNIAINVWGCTVTKAELFKPGP